MKTVSATSFALHHVFRRITVRLGTHGTLRLVCAPRFRQIFDGRQADILDLFLENPHVSIRQAAVDLGLAKTSIHRILQ